MAPISNLKELNAHLQDNSYVGGISPSADDVASLDAVKSDPGSDYPHAHRWFLHLKSFSKVPLPEELPSVAGRGGEEGDAVQAETSSWGAGSGAAAAPADDDDDDEDADLFGSDDDEDDEEKERIKKERLAAYAAKKQKKPGPIAKSSVILDVKPWEAETDMAQMEKDIRGIQMEGLVWGAAKLLPVAYGVKKLQIMCVVEDEKVSIDDLTGKIEEFEDYVQSVDIAAFNKVGGAGRERCVGDEVRKEASLYGDILQADYLDTYRNLSYKAVSWLKFLVTENCPSIQWLVKLDDDTFLDPFHLEKTLLQNASHYNRLSILGKLYKDATMPVIRKKKSKWYISWLAYPHKKFSHYCAGAAFVLGGGLLEPLLVRSYLTRYVSVDDFFLTGLLPLGVQGANWHSLASHYLLSYRIQTAKVTSDRYAFVNSLKNRVREEQWEAWWGLVLLRNRVRESS